MKRKSFKKLHNQIAHCRRCPLYKTASQSVPGEGPSNAKVLFLGEAPGRDEDKTGRPFVGMAGKFLDKLLTSINLPRRKVFITSVIKHRPPKNRKPKISELKACAIWWQKQVGIINPKVMVLLGEVAWGEICKFANLQISNFTQARGNIFKKNGCIYFPTYHPAAARFPKIYKKLQKDFQHIIPLLR